VEKEKNQMNNDIEKIEKNEEEEEEVVSEGGD